MTTLQVNGKPLQIDVPDDMPLLWALRDFAKLTGTKFGCGIAQCGACTVHIDGQPVRSCSISVGAAKDKPITTIEGVHENAIGKMVQEKWRTLDVVQCGYCQSGQIMAATALLTNNKSPSDEEIDQAMSGNVCRCATYVRIRAAIHDAAKALA